MNPARRRKRKRGDNESSAETDDICDLMSKRMLLDPDKIARLEASDRAANDPNFRKALLNGLPPSVSRRLAFLGKDWRDIAYGVVRKEIGNKSFSIMWMDTIGKPVNFNFSQFYHSEWIKGLAVTDEGVAIDDSFEERMDAEGGAFPWAVNDMGRLPDDPRPAAKKVPLKPVKFILTYGSTNMLAHLEQLYKAESDAMFPPESATLYAFSSSMILTSPDNSQVIDITPWTGPSTSDADPGKRLISSIMFPESSHMTMEPFLVVTCSHQPGQCMAKTLEMQKSPLARVPKVLIMYQYLNLDADNSILRTILQCLEPTQDGFELVTGSYDSIDGRLPSSPLQSDTERNQPFISGMLISGDDNCKVTVESVNLLDYPSLLGALSRMTIFFHQNCFPDTSASSMFFYHKAIMDCPILNHSFKSLLKEFRRLCPSLNLYGIGNLSGAQRMLIRDDYDAAFKRINENMRNLHFPGEIKANPEVIFVSLTYKPN